MDNCQLISPEELERIVRRKGLLLGYDQDRLIGFIQEYLEGSMGILCVFPEFRRRGFGAELQKHLILQTSELVISVILTSVFPAQQARQAGC